MTREEILCFLEEDPNIEVYEVTDSNVTYYDHNMGKVTTISFMEAFTVKDLVDKIYISEHLPEFARIDKTGLATYLMKAMEPTAFMTLNKIWILADYADYQLMAKEHSAEALSFYSENSFGQMWFDQNVVFVDFSNILNRAESCADEFEISSETDLKQFVRCEGIVTILHELRHLQLDTNIFLPVDDYPSELAEETMVEDYAVQTFLISLPHGVFIGD